MAGQSLIRLMRLRGRCLSPPTARQVVLGHLAISSFCSRQVRATINQGLVPQWNVFGLMAYGVPSLLPKDCWICTTSTSTSTSTRTSTGTSTLPSPTPSSQTDGKRSDRGTRRSRDDSPNAEPGRKKQKVLKCLSKAIISDTEDEDRQPTGTIVVKQGMTKNVKQPEAEANIGRVQPKGKGKEKAVNIAEPVRGHGLLKADAEEGSLVLLWSAGRAKPSSPAKCHFMKSDLSCSPPTPIVESEDTADTEASATSQDDVEMDHDTDAERDTDIAADMSDEPADQIMVDQPGAIASAADFPADHWLEATDDTPIPIPPPTPLVDPLPFLQTPTILESDVGATVTLVNGLVCLVEKLRQERVIANPSFPPPMPQPWQRVLPPPIWYEVHEQRVVGPSAAPTSLLLESVQTSASRPPVIPTRRVTLSHPNKSYVGRLIIPVNHLVSVLIVLALIQL
ncbi:uncharacterized protein F5147DRAFT_657862 [Suillus discolor]|uniref:Uncharacterized protein n=1 Tax=Suillus discolor TaxID=1912936 RepID=A0A9P7EUR9_9AGAM|nr:uncharacterized protein F5147DRAFT_657862 [Suillus discolor]KAG2091862.1 hypothetical protein F5147DRAFT_657862 [Suillus discolor]